MADRRPFRFRLSCAACVLLGTSLASLSACSGNPPLRSVERPWAASPLRENALVKAGNSPAPRSVTDKAPVDTRLSFLHVQTIVQQNCSGCHAPGAIAPSLASKEDVVSHRDAILAAVSTSRMPKPVGQFKAAGQRETLLQWLKGGEEFSAQANASEPFCAGYTVPSLSYSARMPLHALKNAYADLLGAVPPELAALGSEGTGTYSSSPLSLTLNSQLHGALVASAKSAASNPALTARVTALIGSSAACPETDAGLACFIGVMRKFNFLAWRGDVPEAELTALASRLTSDFPTATAAKRLSLGIRSALMSPRFLFRIESQSPTETSSQRATRIATRMSLFFWNSIPDAALLEAVKNGFAPATRGAVVKALVDSDKFKRSAERFIVEWLMFETPDAIVRKVAGFTYTRNHTLDSYREAGEYFTRLARLNRPLRELYLADETFVNGRLAPIYGIASSAAPETFTLVTLPASRGGIFTLAGFLANMSSQSSPSEIRRGLSVLTAAMCSKPPSPTPEALAIIDDPVALGKVTDRATHPVCSTCHASIDPIGHAFDNFDAIGRERASAKTAGVLPDGTKFANAEELMKHLAASQQVSNCTVANLLSYASGAPLGAKAQRCSADALDRNPDSGLLSVLEDVAAQLASN